MRCALWWATAGCACGTRTGEQPTLAYFLRAAWAGAQCSTTFLCGREGCPINVWHPAAVIALIP